MPFLIISRTIGVFFVKEPSCPDHRSSQIMPYLPNDMFSAKFTQYISLKAYKKLYAASLWTYKPDMYVAASVVTDTHTLMTTVTLVHAPRLD